MAFGRFTFKRNWTNAEDFKTVVNDETQVRADMQALHDETKDGLNDLMSELEAPASAGALGARSYEGEDSTVQRVLDGLAEELKNVSEINADNLGSNNIKLDKKGETTLADQYNTGELAPTVHGALRRILEMFLRKTGDAMSGDLEIQKSSPAIKARNTTTGIMGKVQSTPGGSVVLARVVDEKTQRVVELASDGSLLYRNMIDGVWDKEHILHTGNLEALNSARIITGSYEGTGAWGADNPNKIISLPFKPKVVAICESTTTFWMVRSENGEFSFRTGGAVGRVGHDVEFSFTANGVSWYADNPGGGYGPGAQGNAIGKTYGYIAIG